MNEGYSFWTSKKDAEKTVTEQQTQEPSRLDIYSTWMICPWWKLLCLEWFRWKILFLSSDFRIGRHFLSKGYFYVMAACLLKDSIFCGTNMVYGRTKLKKLLLKSNGKQWLHRWLWPLKVFFPTKSWGISAENPPLAWAPGGDPV